MVQQDVVGLELGCRERRLEWAGASTPRTPGGGIGAWPVRNYAGGWVYLWAAPTRG